MMKDQTNAENTSNCCKVCFNSYDGIQRRPRCLPCGHSYCGTCIRDHLVENKIVCPFCRSEHNAQNSSDFPINYGMESCLPSTSQSPISESLTASLSSEEPEVLSKCLSSLRREHYKEIEMLEAEMEESRSQIQLYKSQLEEWKYEHQRQMEIFQSFAQKHHDVIDCIFKESQNLDHASEQADNMMQELKTSMDDLNGASATRKLLTSMEKSSANYDIAKEFNSEVKELYPDEALIIRSQELREQSKFILKNVRSSGRPTGNQYLQNIASTTADEIPNNAETEDEEVAAPIAEEIIPTSAGTDNEEVAAPVVINIQSKIRTLLDNLEFFQKEQSVQTDENSNSKISQISQTDENSNLNKCKDSQTAVTSSLNVTSLKAPKLFVRYLIESHEVFAVQKRRNLTRYARITLDSSGNVCVHRLQKDLKISASAILLKHKDVVGPFVLPGLTFLDLTAEGRPLGRLRIRLTHEGEYPIKFLRYCTGETGFSYAQTIVYDVENRNKENECVRFGSTGCTSSLCEMTHSIRYKLGVYCNDTGEAGLLGQFHDDDFYVYTKPMVKSTLFKCFGKVEKGLDVLKLAISPYNNSDLKKIVIDDCGIILPRV